MTTFTNHVSFTHVLETIRRAGFGAAHTKVLATFKSDPKFGSTLTEIAQGKRTLLIVPKDSAAEFVESWIETHRPKPKSELQHATQAEIEFEAPAPSEEFIALQDRLVAMEAKLDRMLAIWSPA